jgi:glycosyltransferase involved in cell wall biosynthesis
MATEGDIEGARRLAGDELRLKYVPNVVDVRGMPAAGARPGNENALYVADFTYGPNLEGLDYLAEQVMPLVWNELPEAKVTVVGRGVENPPSDPRIRVLGFVDDLDAAYADADAVVVPLLTGGGSPLKLVEALARAMPVVATSHAAELMTQGSGPSAFLAAPDPPAMAGDLVSVLRGEHPELGARARALAEEHYSVEVLVQLLGDGATP